MILITFSPPSNAFYAECNIPGKYDFVIDFFNRADKTKINVKTLNRKDIYEIENLLLNARKNFLDFLEALSQAKVHKNYTIRDFKLFDFPIYWLTSIAEKQSRNHWLFSFFLFKEFLKSNFYIDQKFIIYLNEQTSYLKNEIIEFNKMGSIKREIEFFIPHKIYNFKTLINIIKTQAQFISFQFPKKSFNFSNEPQIQIITASTNRFFYTQFLRFSATENFPIAFKPLCISSINSQNVNYISKNFLKYKPSITSSINILFKSLVLYFELRKIKNNLKINQTNFPIEILRLELYEVLKNAQLYFIKFLWYKNYFSHIQNKTIFFLDDEFYIAGRIISKAFSSAKNKHIKLFGLQHGMFSESHTVYSIMQKELENIKNEDAIPIPQKFIVWGDFFKKKFNQFNNLNDYAVPLGSPHFIELKNKLKTKQINQTQINYILWCTTGHEQFIFELPFVIKLMQINQLPLIIRLHPGGHINKNFVFENLKNIHFQFDNEINIYESILKSQFVVTSAHSTVVLDCLVCNKIVYRIIFDRDDNIFNHQEKLIINIKHLEQIEEFKYASNLILNKENCYLYLSDDRWKQFLKTEFADNV